MAIERWHNKQYMQISKADDGEGHVDEPNDTGVMMRLRIDG